MIQMQSNINTYFPCGSIKINKELKLILKIPC